METLKNRKSYTSVLQTLRDSRRGPDYYTKQNSQSQLREREIKTLHDKTTLKKISVHQSSSIEVNKRKLQAEGKVNYTKEDTRNNLRTEHQGSLGEGHIPPPHQNYRNQ